MYLAIRPFRDVKGFVSAGSPVEPADIRNFKRRVFEGHVVELTKSNFDRYAAYLLGRRGVDISAYANKVKGIQPVVTIGGK